MPYAPKPRIIFDGGLELKAKDFDKGYKKTIDHSQGQITYEVNIDSRNLKYWKQISENLKTK